MKSISIGKGGLAPLAAAQVETSPQKPATSESSQLSLSSVRTALIRQEDTIIFALIERAQYARNAAVYQSGEVPVPGYMPSGERMSLLDYILRETEECHAKIGRYNCPEEHAFSPGVGQMLVIPPPEYNSPLASYQNSININTQIKSMYLEDLLPGITREGDDQQYGSTAVADVSCLSALSRRIHYGKMVAEAKFTENPEMFRKLIEDQDAQGILDSLTYPEQEANVVARVAYKASVFGRDLDSADSHPNVTPLEKRKVSPDVVAELYQKHVMPLTKEVQVQYLLRRLGAQ